MIRDFLTIRENQKGYSIGLPAAVLRESGIVVPERPDPPIEATHVAEECRNVLVKYDDTARTLTIHLPDSDVHFKELLEVAETDGISKVREITSTDDLSVGEVRALATGDD